MFVWGSKGGVLDLGQQQSSHCPVCEKERNFRLMLQYKVNHLWYVFKWVSDKQYAMVCDVCRRGEKLVTQAVEAKLGKPRIPSTSSRAWMFVVAVLVAGIAWGWVANSRRHEQMDALLAAPQKGDLYILNVARLVENPQHPVMYALLRVRSVDGERLQFDTPTVAYERGSRAAEDLRAGKDADPAYFAGAPLAASRGDLAGLSKVGSLWSIDRPMNLDLAGAARH